MNPVIDRMLGLTADIAEELLLIKDAERDTLPDGLKLKIISLAELAATVDEPSVEEESPAPEEMVSELPETEVETPAEEAQEEIPAAEDIIPEAEKREAEGNEEPVAEEVASSDAADDATDDADAEAESAEFEEEADANADIEDCPREEEVEETADVVIEPEPDTEPEGDVEPVVVSSSETVAAPSENSDAATEESPDRVEQQPEVVEQPAEEPVEQKSDNRNITPADLYRAFSINDAFYYRREIFGGSRQQMMEALVRISMLPDRQALREYLVERLALNLDESPGKEFYQSLSSFL
ncbi:MAG: hypothetical protein K2L39_03175 [Muribaculaceae bacterium]|nr:hypothetical protein [Muribaculaceae bacterium]